MDEDLESDGGWSVDSVTITDVLEMVLEDGGYLCYRCRTSDDTDDVFDRSDLMDGAKQQQLVLQFERHNPPPWDEVCSFCDGAGCEECVCEECERQCRHIKGVNYGCCKHPVV